MSGSDVFGPKSVIPVARFLAAKKACRCERGHNGPVCLMLMLFQPLVELVFETGAGSER
jgi:hypothetical protein